ncbi:hypothetical protein [Azospirillum sp. TSO35-2]|uniref:hypothetical protein n=1 Tax=Azospirillum sp. TSO35-2 TaxID=716796 RepID=UPI000D60DA72|nr:hypothetical protein [Azospirillum sp. TSO35-2]PWC39780.1 hypothetical protein TSO352_06730 [Azospirillum sp. TSO35-2]
MAAQRPEPPGGIMSAALRAGARVDRGHPPPRRLNRAVRSLWDGALAVLCVVPVGTAERLITAGDAPGDKAMIEIRVDPPTRILRKGVDGVGVVGAGGGFAVGDVLPPGCSTRAEVAATPGPG